ncbi:MAG: chemotaxis protein CheW [Bacillota bacterium]
MDMNQYLEIFIDESREHLQEMNQILLELEKNPDDLSLLDEIFRIAHTIKGMAGTMGYDKISDLTHKMENVMDEMRSGNVTVKEQTVDILFECFDSLEEYVDNLIATGEEGDLDSTELIKKLGSIVSGEELDEDVSEQIKETKEVKEENVDSDFEIELTDTIKGLINKALDSGMNTFKVKVTINEDSMLKAARAFIVFNKLEELGEIISSEPEAEDIEDEKFDTSFELIYFSKIDSKTLTNEILSISEIDEVLVEQVDSKYDLKDKKKETQTNKDKSSKNKSKSTKSSKKKVTKKKSRKRKKMTQTVRVDINRLDNLMNLVSELIIIKTRLEDNDASNKESSNIHETVEYLERITTSLHDAVMKVRMVPVERTFNRFPRMVRDLSKELGKEINLEMTGEDTEVDRTVIDEIGDPLIHLIRNSIDHGIEETEKRIELGKPEAGTVNLRAYPDGNTVVIEVEDDGGGIDPDMVLENAIEKNVITKDEAEKMNEHEAINLLFEPGFSTVKEVTDLSGRGVGLDVVKSKIEALNGTVEVSSELKKGSKFTIRLPLTLAIIQALMIDLKEERYAIPLNNIKEIATINSEKISMVQNQEVVLYRENTLPLVRLGEVLNVEEYERNTGDMLVVIIKKGNQEAGVIVDNLVGQQEIVIKSLGNYLQTIDTIAGATILGNGGVALIVDPNQLF